MAMQVKVTYAGVSLSKPPIEFSIRHPEKRHSFFEVPWGMSCPGYGIVLATHTQLSEIETAITGDGYGDLVLSTYDDADPSHPVVDSITLQGIYLVKATPIWGDCFTPDSANMKVSEGLWELELQDHRAALLMECPDTTSADGLATFNVTTSSGTYVTATLKTGSAYKLSEILDEVAGEHYGITGDVANAVFKNVNLVALPTTLCADLLLSYAPPNSTVKVNVIRYDPVTDAGVVASKTIDDLLGAADTKYTKVKNRQIFGGYTKLYPATLIPEKEALYFPKSDVPLRFDGKNDAHPTCRNWLKVVDSTVSLTTGQEAISPVITGSRVPSMRSLLVDGTSDTSYYSLHQKATPQYHGVFHGFIREALKSDYLLGLVRLSWSDLPITEVHSGSCTPVESFLRGPNAHSLKAIPHRLGPDGDLSLFLDRGPTYGFLVRVMGCDETDGTVEVQAVENVLLNTYQVPIDDASNTAKGENFFAFNGKSNYYQEGDIAVCIQCKIRLRSGVECDYLLLEQFKGDNYYANTAEDPDAASVHDRCP